MLQPVEGADSGTLLKTDDNHLSNNSSENDSGTDDRNQTETEERSIGDLMKNSFRLLRWEKPIHHFLGGGKSADVILWRNKNISATTFAGGTVIWLLFECPHHNFLRLNYHELFVEVALSLRNEFNRASKTFQDVASTPDLKKFLLATMVLWVISVIGSWFSLLTLLYLVFVMFLTLPMLYEKHEDHVDTFAEKAFAELKKQCSVLDETLLQKLPISSLKKQHLS